MVKAPTPKNCLQKRRLSAGAVEDVRFTGISRLKQGA